MDALLLKRIAEKIFELDKLLTLEILENSNNHESQISSIIVDIIEKCFADYDVQRQAIPHLLNIYEKHNAKSVSYLISVFLRKLTKVSHLKIEKYKFPFGNYDVEDDQRTQITREILHYVLSQKKEHRLLDTYNLPFPVKNLDIFCETANKLIAHIANNIFITPDDITIILIQLGIVRNIALQTKQESAFYFMLTGFFDLLHRSEKYQICRDIAEENLLCGYTDNSKHFAYFNLFKVFASTGDIYTSLHYAICSLTLSETMSHVNDHLLKHVYWNAIILFRNINFHPFAIQTFKNIPKNLVFSPKEKDRITHTYFTVLLTAQEANAPRSVSTYLDENRENVINSSEANVVPWLVTLYNIVFNYPHDLDGVSECAMYLAMLENCVPAEKIKKYKDIWHGDLESLKRT